MQDPYNHETYEETQEPNYNVSTETNFPDPASETQPTT